MSIQGDYLQLQRINTEIKRLNSVLKDLRNSRNKVKERIKEYLYSINQPGFQYKGEAVILKKKPKRTTKPAKLRQEDTIRILERLGLEHPEKAWQEIEDARKGDTVEDEDVVITKTTARKRT